MERQLMNAYDQIVMPDDCSRKIEQALRQREQHRPSGLYSRSISPTAPVRRRWVVAMLMLVVCLGSLCAFWISSRMYGVPIPSQSTTPADSYSTVTDIPSEEVEAFAREIRDNLLEEDWEAFAEKAAYPITIRQKVIAGEGGLVGLFIRNTVSEEFLEDIRWESCEAMPCDADGISMGGGRIRIKEVNGELKITAIRGLFTDLVEIQDFIFEELENGFLAVTAYRGQAEEITFYTAYNRRYVIQIGNGSSVIRNGNAVKTVHVPDSVTTLDDRAFANCSALESVFFDGDAPVTGKDIFEGSPNVTVYYPEGAKGWTNPWQGRPAVAYGKADISTGIRELDIGQQESANLVYDNILRGTEKIDFPEWNTEYTISQYCDRRTSETGKQVSCPCFTLVDMDDDGVKELILRICTEGEKKDDYLILRYLESDAFRMVYCYAELRQMISGLKKDGAFYWDQENPRWVNSLEEVSQGPDNGLSLQEVAEKIPARWHNLSVTDPGWTLDSYRVISEDVRGEEYGGQLFYFEQLITGKSANDWEELRRHLTVNGFLCEENMGSISVYDPASPGCVLSGTVDENGKLDSVAYYVCHEKGERMAEVRQLPSDQPEYRVQMQLLLENGELGRQVTTAEEVLQYIKG